MERFLLGATRAALLSLMVGGVATGQQQTSGQRPAAGAFGPQRSAQPQAAPRTASTASGALSPYPTRVAVMDVKKVFEQHLGFKRRMEAIDADVKKLQQDMTNMKKWAEGEQKKTAEMPKSPERAQREAQLAQAIANFRVQEALKRKEILEKEAAVYYETYQEIERAVQGHCQRQRIELVMRFDSRPMNPNDRASVMSTVNRGVVYQAQSLDITAPVLSAVNGQQAR